MGQRNTRTHRLCPTCEGAGELTVNRSAFYASGLQDPQCDESAPCPDCMTGWIRTAPRDALEDLQSARRVYLRQRSFSLLGAEYRKARATAVRPVQLPAVRV